MTLHATANPQASKIPQMDIVLPTHGKLELTMQAVNALYGNTMTPFHLIVVDDSDPKTDLTPEYFNRLAKERDNITFIHSTTPFKNGNQFFNVALRHSETDVFVPVMNSVTVEPEWELVGLELLKEHQDVGIIALKNLLPNGAIESAGITMKDYLPIDIGRDLPGHRLCGTYEVPSCQWAFSMLRKKAVVGNMDENIFNGFVGWDDIDNCFAVRNKGWKILYCGMGAGFHKPRSTRGDNSQEAAKKNAYNAEVFWKRWGYWDMMLQATRQTAAQVEAVGLRTPAASHSVEEAVASVAGGLLTQMVQKVEPVTPGGEAAATVEYRPVQPIGAAN